MGLLSFLELLRVTDLTHIVLDAIALAVAAMPEGLPLVVTVTLALDAARPGIMFERPRGRTEPVLPFSRLTKIIAYGITDDGGYTRSTVVTTVVVDPTPKNGVEHPGGFCTRSLWDPKSDKLLARFVSQ